MRKVLFSVLFLLSLVSGVQAIEWSESDPNTFWEKGDCIVAHDVDDRFWEFAYPEDQEMLIIRATTTGEYLSCTSVEDAVPGHIRCGGKQDYDLFYQACGLPNMAKNLRPEWMTSN